MTIEEVEALLDRVDEFPEREREITTELVQALLDMYGEGLSRIVAVCDVPVQDELVAHLLLLHGLHPVPVRERVMGALDEVRPYLATHGGGVELLDVSGGVVRLRLEGACNGCPSSALTLQSAVDEAVMRAAPDIERIEAEGVAAPSGLLQIEHRMSTLMRLAQRSTVAREAALEHCELCGTAIGPEHRHVLELATRDVKCACRPCGLLFERAEKLKLIPADVRRAEAVDLGVPVDMVFVARVDGKFKAFYPSPVGPTESLLEVSLGVELADDVEALLVRGERAWIVGIDVCFALVGLVRTYWQGITGGVEVRRELDAFFDGLDRRAR